VCVCFVLRAHAKEATQQARKFFLLRCVSVSVSVSVSASVSALCVLLYALFDFSLDGVGLL